MSRIDLAFGAALVLALIAWCLWLIRLSRDNAKRNQPRGDDWGGDLFAGDDDENR